MNASTGGDDPPITLSLATIRERIGNFSPEVMVMLGSGLGETMRPSEILHTVGYDEIPGMAVPSIAGHPGKLFFGVCGGRKTMVFQGRLHFYEGHSWSRITLPVRLAAALGVSTCLFTNMSGAIHPRLRAGSMLVVDDHLNFMGANPLIGMTTAEFVFPRSADDSTTTFPDMQEAYSKRLRNLLDQAATRVGIELQHGVYAGVSGPNYETPAEVRALGLLGADVVGMSTVGEVIVARQAGLECAAISCIANPAAGVSDKPIRHQDVLQTASSLQHQLAQLVDAFLRLL